MYNRYIRGDQGSYTRILEDEPAPAEGGGEPQQMAPSSAGAAEGKGGLFDALRPGGESNLRGLLDRFHLDRVDSGDLLLLALLFLLYREGAEEELLFALGLLLIL